MLGRNEWVVNYELGNLLIKVGLACFFWKQNFSVKIRGGVGFMKHLEMFFLLIVFGAGKIIKVIFLFGIKIPEKTLWQKLTHIGAVHVFFVEIQVFLQDEFSKYNLSGPIPWEESRPLFIKLLLVSTATGCCRTNLGWESSSWGCKTGAPIHHLEQTLGAEIWYSWRVYGLRKYYISLKESCWNTVDGRNPAPVAR